MNPWQFDVARTSEDITKQLMDECELPHFIAATLVGRGVTTKDQVDKFFHPYLDRDWEDPNCIPGLPEVTEALHEAIKADKHILVFGDFDVDGISATTLLTRALRELGVKTTPFIPKRFEEGYGISVAALDRIETFEERPDVIITVDTGISCRETVKEAQARGYEVLITDHHETADLVPEGVPVADPKIDEACPSTILSGAGVALKLVQMLGNRLGRPHLWQSYTDLATLGTVADLMPMTGENRALVADGIYKLNATPRPCIRAMLEESGSAGKEITASNLSFSVIPRLNAAGRMGNCDPALNLLLTDDFKEAFECAQKLSEVNEERRNIETVLAAQAEEQADEIHEVHPEYRVMVVAGEGWHEGVKGIVASRLVGKYGVPCLLFTLVDGEARGSGRSVGSINLFRAVESTSDLLTRFGGHAAAVGVTLPIENLPEFTRRLCEYMNQLPDDSFHPQAHVDSLVKLEELTLANVALLKNLEPFGQENEAPTFLAQNVTLTNARAVGVDKNHLSCTLSDGRAEVAAIMFRCPNIEEMQQQSSVVNVAFGLQIDEWHGRKTVKAMVSAIATETYCKALEGFISENDVSFVSDLYSLSDEEQGVARLPESMDEDERIKEALMRNREMWELSAVQDKQGIRESIIRALIHDGELHPAQQAALDSLEAKYNVLSIMATGRGKSLVFQVHAALLALTEHRSSLFVYPLRALIADQAFHLNDTLKVFGISSEVLNGETAPEERQQIFDGLASGDIDIVLTTPEFLECHAAEFAATGKIGFVVIDEAHHIGQINNGSRSSYGVLPAFLSMLDDAHVLACTATADDAVSEQIRDILHIDEVISDVKSRDNLNVVDYRDNRNRDDYLACLIARGEKTIVYVNSRKESVLLARMLRNRVPQMAMRIGFYNAALSRSERIRIEEMFRTGALQVLVATSAFGEGVNISDIRHVALYHMPFNEIELNQISGRAGRDGRPATIHLLFNSKDAQTNDYILKTLTPDREVMVEVYKYLREKQKARSGEFFLIDSEDFENLDKAHNQEAINPASMKCGIAVFRDLGLIETQAVYADGKTSYAVRVKESANKVELSESVRYREGFSERECFESFNRWIMGAKVDVLQLRINTPITPRLIDRLFGGDE